MLNIVFVLIIIIVIIIVSQFLDNLWWLAPGLLGYIFNWYRRRFMAPEGVDKIFTVQECSIGDLVTG